MRTNSLFGAKKLCGLFEIHGVPHGKEGRGLNQCWHFVEKGEGVNFSRFCTVVFHGQPLYTRLLLL